MASMARRPAGAQRVGERLAGRPDRWHQDFVRDCPFFSTQIALMRAGRLVLGVSSAMPTASWLGRKQAGGLARRSRRCASAPSPTLAAAILSVGNLKTLAASPTRWSRLGALIGRVNRLRGYGDFLHYHLLARGALDVVLESDVNILDIAALTVSCARPVALSPIWRRRHRSGPTTSIWPPIRRCTRPCLAAAGLGRQERAPRRCAQACIGVRYSSDRASAVSIRRRPEPMGPSP